VIIKYIEFFILTYEVIIHNFILFCCWLTHRELVIDKMNRNAKQIVWRFQICSVKSDGSKEIARRDQSPVYNKSILKKSCIIANSSAISIKSADRRNLKIPKIVSVYSIIGNINFILISRCTSVI